MVRKGIDFKKLAAAFNVTPQAVYEVIKGRMNSNRIEAMLEDILEMPIADIRAAWNNTQPGGDEIDIHAVARRVNQRLNIAASA